MVYTFVNLCRALSVLKHSCGRRTSCTGLVCCPDLSVAHVHAQSRLYGTHVQKGVTYMAYPCSNLQMTEQWKKTKVAIALHRAKYPRLHDLCLLICFSQLAFVSFKEHILQLNSII